MSATVYTNEYVIGLCNFISNNITGSVFSKDEFRDIIDLLRRIDPKKLPDDTIEAYKYISNLFITRNVQSEPAISAIYGIDPEFMAQDYLTKEFNKLTVGESALKYIKSPEGRDYTILRDGMSPFEFREPVPPPPIEEQTLNEIKKITSTLCPESYTDVNRYANMSWVTFNTITLNTHQITLDSRYRYLNPNDPFVYTWDLNTADTTRALTSLRAPVLQQIVRMEGNKFMISYADVNELLSGVIEIRINELSTKGVVSDIITSLSQQTRSYNLHYFVEGIIDDATILITPNPGVFIFNEPITLVNRLTIQFYYPDGILSMPQDFLIAAVVAGNPTVFISANHGLSVGDLVSVNMFSSDDSNLDIAMNAPSGNLVFSVIDVNTFTIDLDSSAAIITSSSVTVYINKYRFVINLKFTCLE